MGERKEEDDDDWEQLLMMPQPHHPPQHVPSMPVGVSLIDSDAIDVADVADGSALHRLSLDDHPTTITNTLDANRSSPTRSSHHTQIQLPSPSPPRSQISPSGSNAGGREGALPEFVGRGGGQGIFQLPPRGPVHPGRPPPLELRPHPLRETQVGSSLLTIAGSASQLWAGHESGVRVWDLCDVFEGWGQGKFASWRPKRGDEGSAPFRESVRTPPALCLVVDAASGLVWSGHGNGRVRSWRMEQPATNRGGEFSKVLSWQAHYAPVLSMVITSYGELWSGSEGGDIKAWPWEAIDKSLSLTMEGHMAASLLERSCIDLRSLVTVGGVCPLPTAEIRFLLSDNSTSKIWSGGYMSFALWDSHKKELLKVFNIDGQVETRFDFPVNDPSEEDVRNVNVFSVSKKEKQRSPLSFFQRSRNALMGAADAVRRVAVKGVFGDDNRRAETLTMSVDGMIWIGCKNGLLVQWDGNGNRLREVQHHSSSVQCLCSFGTRLWPGYVDGTVQVMDLEGNLLGGWVAHGNPVIKMVVAGSYVFTLANHGGIRGWNLTSPGPLDNILQSELTQNKLSYTKLENVKILTGTWNVGQERASKDSLMAWLGHAASDVKLVVVGLQEVEMGAGFLAMAAAKETVGLEGSANGQWWLDAIGRILEESFEFVGSRQMAGLLVAVWARKNLKSYIGDVDAAAVPCGFGNAIGNKGAVGLKMRIYDRKLCFVNCHFAAHLEAVNQRNADFEHVFRTMAFSRPSNGLNAGTAGAYVVQLLRGASAMKEAAMWLWQVMDERKPDLSEADMVIFLGDFNYRLHSITFDEAMDLVSRRCFDQLREKDQLRAEMKAGKVFQGFREGQIEFPPTYKFEKHQTGLAGYDSSEKKRIPAWCDRILYRDSCSIPGTPCSLEYPVVSSISQYNACMDVIDSDHKPVKCIFDVDIAYVDELVQRRVYRKAIQSNENAIRLLEKYRTVPETIVSSDNIILQNQETSVLRITNKCERDKALFEIMCQGQKICKKDGQVSELRARGSFGFPHWLKVSPAVGVIKPGQTIEVSLQHVDLNSPEESVDGILPNQQSEDTGGKVGILVVNITGSCSTERRSYCISVQQSMSLKTTYNEENVPRGLQPNILQVPDLIDFD